MKNYIVGLGALVFMASAVLPVGVAFAVEGSDDTTQTTTTLQNRKAEAQAKLAESKKAAQEQLAEAKKEAQAKLEARKAEIKTKLDAKRLEKCNARESKVNEINKKFATKAQERLTKLAGATDKLTAIVADKNLTVTDYDALVADVNTKAAAASAALANVQAVDFNCDQEGVNREFGQYIKTNIQTVHAAVKSYRDSVKALAKAIREAAAAQAAAEKPEDSTTETETSTNSTTN